VPVINTSHQYPQAILYNSVTRQCNSTNTAPNVQSSQCVKIRKFTGTESLQTFLSQFESAAQFNRWDEQAKHAHLLNSLGGEAADSILDCGPTNIDTYCKLVAALRSRFGDVGGVQNFQEELRNRKQQPGETLQSLQLDIRRLTAKAYPGTSPDTNNVLACNAFIEALLNKDKALKIREKHVNNMDEAYVQAMRLESLYGDKLPKLNKVAAVCEAATQKSCDTCPTCSRTFSNGNRTPKTNSRQFNKLNERSNFTKGYGQHTHQMQILQPFHQPNVMLNNFQTFNTPAPSPNYMNGRRYQQCDTKGPCFNCNVMGHYARNCLYKNAYAVNQTPQTSLANAQMEVSTPVDYQVQFCQSVHYQNARKPTYLKGQIQGQQTVFLVDTGCETCILPERYAPTSCQRSINSKLLAANGTAIEILGYANVIFCIKHDSYTANFIITSDVDEIILGQTFLSQLNLIWNMA
jgi:hypothetical protein